ncbi:MAG: DUF550 domain-containing protein [Acidobacteria bacterium]|nr:DUF550 domain-containing protein [Acidobacteriota bacterium]
MEDFQKEVGDWVTATFQNATLNSIVTHLKREVLELANDHEPQEAADCLILLLHHAHIGGYNLLEEAKKKLQINKKRQWASPDKNGVVEHLKE